MIDLYEKGKAKYPWWQDWRGECVAIVASGPSIKNVNLEQLKGRINVIAINENHRLCPWADILYSCDADWWTICGREIKRFNGVKIGFAVHIKGIEKIEILKRKDNYVHELLVDDPGVIGSGQNSGFQTINLSVQFGATAIALLGFDMNVNNGIHWHGGHKVPLRNPDNERCAQWAKHVDSIAPKLNECGIDVVNCSPVSQLKSYPKITMEEALSRWGL